MWVKLAFSFFGLCFMASAARADLETIEAFTKFPQIYSIKIAPDGDHLGLLASSEGRKVLMILEADTYTPVNVIKFGSSKQIGEFHWANDERVLVRLEYFQSWYSEAPSSAGEWYAINIDGSKEANIFGYRSGKGTSSKIQVNEAPRSYGLLTDLLPNDSRKVLFTSIRFDQDGDVKPELYEVDIVNGRTKLVTQSPVANGRFLTDESGVARFVVGTDLENNQETYHRKSKRDKWKLLSRGSVESGSMRPLAFGVDGRAYVLDDTVTDTKAIVAIDLATGEREEVIRHARVDPSDIWYAQSKKNIYAVEFMDGQTEIEFLDVKSSQSLLLQSLLATFPEQQVKIVSQSKDEKKSIIAVWSDTLSPEFYLHDAKKGEMRFIISSRPWLKNRRLSPMLPLDFKASDGLQISAYLTLPNGPAPEGGFPLILNPHGGPHGVRDIWGFNGEVQLLAASGYAVLQVNFRGSGGYGKGFLSAGYRHWGDDIQTDLIAGVEYVTKNYDVDASNVCIYGASFGGYSALQAPIVKPGMFKCAAGFVGVYDLTLMYTTGDIPERASGRAFLEKVIGVDEAELKRFSPVHRVNELDLPIFLVHGEDDPRAPIDHAYALREALDKAEKPYEWLSVDKEGHGFYDGNNRLVMYNQLLGFFQRHIGPKN
jgi:dipeptidyl aminopeptidase/acylaminoacyl peptidase